MKHMKSISLLLSKFESVKTVKNIVSTDDSVKRQVTD